MIVLVMAGAGLVGGLGAVARFSVDRFVASRSPFAFPLGTMLVNLSGSFLLGVLVGAAVSGDSLRLAGTGFLGAYTTFSTWMFESERLGEEGAGRLAVANVVVSLILGVTMAWLGRELGGLI